MGFRAAAWVVAVAALVTACSEEGPPDEGGTGSAVSTHEPGSGETPAEPAGRPTSGEESCGLIPVDAIATGMGIDPEQIVVADLTHEAECVLYLGGDNATAQTSADFNVIIGRYEAGPASPAATFRQILATEVEPDLGESAYYADEAGTAVMFAEVDGWDIGVIVELQGASGGWPTDMRPLLREWVTLAIDALP